MSSPRTPVGRMVARLRRNRLAVVALSVMVLIHLAVALAPWLAPSDPETVSLADRLQAPGARRWLGTDEYGRDVLTRLLYGGRVSLAVGLTSMIASMVLGVVVGAIAGYAGGVTDGLLMRLTDGMLSVPLFFIALMALALLGATMLNLVLVIALSSWMTVARVVRAEVLRTRELEYVQAARAIGASGARILARHVVPQSIPSITVAATLGVAYAVLLETSLSFLGLGVQPPAPSWGNMLSGARGYLRTVPGLAVFPGIMIFITVLCYNWFGDGLRDAIDPTLAER
ncbi:MAG: ABC transporter permease [Armatimonadetes bacterium RBG_16_67_12]|nr:MAG: ABC transporter permease [Armatimonadetes bacterium RBG_16_67_12]